jgi:hypothetical protein
MGVEEGQSPDLDYDGAYNILVFFNDHQYGKLVKYMVVYAELYERIERDGEYKTHGGFYLHNRKFELHRHDDGSSSRSGSHRITAFPAPDNLKPTFKPTNDDERYIARTRMRTVETIGRDGWMDGRILMPEHQKRKGKKTTTRRDGKMRNMVEMQISRRTETKRLMKMRSLPMEERQKLNEER